VERVTHGKYYLKKINTSIHPYTKVSYCYFTNKEKKTFFYLISRNFWNFKEHNQTFWNVLHSNKLRVESTRARRKNSTRKCVQMTRLLVKFKRMRVDFYIYLR
jgi:hypothetical protein